MNDPSPYVSCIRIDGVPIIGPVMTDEKRSQMRRYRELAIAREADLSKRRALDEKRDSQHTFTVRTDGMVIGRADSKHESKIVDLVDEDVPDVPQVPHYQEEDKVQQPHRPQNDESEVSFQSCSSKLPPSGYSSDDSTFRSNSHRDYTSTTPIPNDGETTDASLITPFRPDSSSSIATTTSHLIDEYLADLSIRSQASSQKILPIQSIDSDDHLPRPRLIRSNSYTLDEPSPAFLKHLQLHQSLQHCVQPPATDEKQDDEISEKNIIVPTQPEESTSTDDPSPYRRKSLDMTINASGNKRAKVGFALKKTPTGNGGGPTSRRSRPAFERVYATKTKTASSNGPKSGSTTQRKPPVVINGLAVEGQKLIHVEPIPQSAQQRARKAYESPYMLTRPPTRTQTENQSQPLVVQTPPQSQPAIQPQILPPAALVIQPAPSSPPPPPPEHQSPSFDEKRIVQLIQQMEINRKRQMDDLVERQQIEQRRLQDTFNEQQRLLVTQITQQCSTMIATCQQNVTTQLEEAKALLSPPKTDQRMQILGLQHDDETSTDDQIKSSLEDEVNNNNNIIPKKISNNLSSSSSCSRDGSGDGGSSTITAVSQYSVKPVNEDPEVADQILRPAVNTSRRLDFGDTRSTRADGDDDVEWMAATRINAYARGFLTRRLFRTEDVQTIVKLIRDTLLFVIDLHHEENQNEDLQLKRSLLNQLNSSCDMLHDIFFNKSTVQRMEIISTDRRIQRRKLLNAKRQTDQEPPTTTTTSTNNPRHIESNKSLNKLSRIILFPVEILGKRMTRSETLLSSEQRTPLAMLVMASRRTKSLSSLPRMVGADEPIW